MDWTSLVYIIPYSLHNCYNYVPCISERKSPFSGQKRGEMLWIRSNAACIMLIWSPKLHENLHILMEDAGWF